ncbi:DUF2264 domain-containing protein [Microbacterium indicum]|uniref:DUF2264 domain-containing protein n=1 Tax=Microbacterium indicum TaxID=358100 RepID=UPI0003F69E07|nr:DUF2264 domain-containing protein [Microbacterium indicum]
MTAAELAPEWTRDDLTAYADRLLEAALAHASEGGARIEFPGAEGGYGHDVDGLEGFARTFLLAGFRIAGERGHGVDRLIDFCTRAIARGVDPEASDRWVRPDEHGQAKVEAASIALILDMTREWIWDRLDAVTQGRVVDYLAPVVGDTTYPRNNWLWFRIVVETFLRSVGGPWSQEDIDADLALNDEFARDGGWYSDGDGRAYDHYVGWAMHLYPILWARMRGADELAGDRPGRDRRKLGAYLADAVHLVGGDGGPLIQGRSLIYRFAAAAPFWAGAIAGVDEVPLGELRRAGARIVQHFADRGVPGPDGVLTMGWFDEWRQMAQSYSGTGSPYWAAKGLLGIALPADHPVWAAPAEPLPIERGDTLRALPVPGWIVSGTAADGVVRVVNHGTDHALPGTVVGDSPLYARLGYSTAASPLLDDAAWTDPLEQSVALVDGSGRATHRAAMTLRAARVDDGVGVAASSWDAHTIDPVAGARNHGSGVAGEAEVVAPVTVVSLVRGAHEVRLARVGAAPDGWCLRFGGWAAAGDGAPATALRLAGGADAVVVVRADASPLGPVASIPVADAAIVAGEWAAAELALGAPAGCGIAVDGDAVSVTWPDGHRSDHDLRHFLP